MKNSKFLLAVVLVILSFFPACQKESPIDSNRAVIAISSDINSYNPLYAVNFNEGMVMQLLYPSLVRYKWNNKTGELDAYPMLAKKWEWNLDSTSITFYLQDNAKWTDGESVTAEDIVFSFDVYSDPKVESRYYGSFKTLPVDSTQHIILTKTFKIENPHEVTIYFKKDAIPSLSEINLPILPKHVYKGIDRKDFITAEKTLKPVSDGPFYLDKWEKNQAIFLKANTNFIFYNKENLGEIIFKIIPDYNSSITQLKNGEVDFVQDVKADDIPVIKKNNNLIIDPIKGRDYDYIGWNNIDPQVYEKTKKIVPNKLFGNPLVREALTYALNRKEVVDQFLDNYGQLAVSPIAPIFKNALDTTLHPFPFDPQKAKELLTRAGWQDVNNEGILSKGGKKFSFTLYIPSGNPRREFAAALFKNNLRAIGIDMKVEALEPGVFFPKMYKKEFDAWIAGWTVAIPILLKPLWYSTLPDGAYNVVTYQNRQVDEVIDNIIKSRSAGEKNFLYKEFQQIIYKDQPTTFLYWIDNIVVYNKRLQNVKISPLGPIDNCWEWRVNK